MQVRERQAASISSHRSLVACPLAVLTCLFAIAADGMLLVLVTFSFAVRANLSDDFREFPDVRRIGRRELLECATGGDRISHRARAGCQFGVAFAKKSEAVGQTDVP